MNKKMAIVLIALVGIGLYALPSTVALFSGQHTFVNLDPTGNQIDCVKCHGDVRAELGGSNSSVSGTPGAHAAFKCEFCHRIEAGYSSGDNAYAELIYTDGNVSRKLVVTLMDMEAKNIPVSMLENDTYDILRVAPTISGNPLFRSTSATGAQLSVSPCYPATCSAGTTLYPPAEQNMRPTPLYNISTPKDTDPVTKNQGFDITKVTWNLVGTNQTINLTGAGSRTVNPGTKYHAASLVSCMECHRGKEPMGHYARVTDDTEASSSCAKCHYGTSSSEDFTRTLWAGGFNLTGIVGDTGTSEAHMEFTKTNDMITRYEYGASNGACIACHTHVAVNITYMKPHTLKWHADFLSNGTESVSQFSATGTVESYSS